MTKPAPAGPNVQGTKFGEGAQTPVPGFCKAASSGAGSRDVVKGPRPAGAFGFSVAWQAQRTPLL